MKILHAQIAHDLTIYSPEGLKFTLIANGEQINAEAASRVKMENVEEDYVNVKILFENDSIPPLEKKFLQIADPGTNVPKPVSTVWTIIEKNGQYKFKFLSRSDKKIQPKETLIIQQQPEDDSDIKIKVPGVEIEVDEKKH
ncbi:MAG TPA: hypothetical protein VNJ07_06460 [Chitinophagales bacterium]|nr:hypothetical protein [Chitinophagales bacterium]